MSHKGLGITGVLIVGAVGLYITANQKQRITKMETQIPAMETKIKDYEAFI